MPHGDLLASPHVSSRADYIAQFQAEMVRALPTQSTREKDAFSALGLHEQAWRFMNWQSRLVHPHPRQVNRTNGFDNLPDVQANRSGVEALLASLARGKDVAAHLSHDVMQGYCLHRDGKKHGSDFDMLLNEWGIHHLHIHEASTTGSLITRGKHLLYVILGRGVAFALTVAPHRAWTSRRLIEATVRSWPHQRLFVPLQGALPMRSWSEDEHTVLRRAGATTATVVDGQCWVSGVTCGISTALVSTRVVMETGQLLRILHEATADPMHVKRQLINNAAINGVAWPSDPAISVRWLNGHDRYCFGFIEEACGAVVLIDTA